MLWVDNKEDWTLNDPEALSPVPGVQRSPVEGTLTKILAEVMSKIAEDGTMPLTHGVGVVPSAVGVSVTAVVNTQSTGQVLC